MRHLDTNFKEVDWLPPVSLEVPACGGNVEAAAEVCFGGFSFKSFADHMCIMMAHFGVLVWRMVFVRHACGAVTAGLPVVHIEVRSPATTTSRRGESQ